MSPGTKSVLIFYVGYRSSLSLFSRPFYSSRPGQKRIYTLDQANSDKVREYDIIRTRDIRFTTGDIDQAASIYLVKKKKKREIDSIVVYICSPLLSLFLSPSLCLLFAVFDYSRWLGTRDVSFMKLDKATSFLHRSPCPRSFPVEFDLFTHRNAKFNVEGTWIVSRPPSEPLYG